MKSTRLFEILLILLDKRKTTSTELAKNFEVSVRTIYRDLDALTTIGIPIYTSTGKNGGIHLMENYVLDKAFVSSEEQNDILFALHCLSTVPNLDEGAILKKLSVLFKQNSNTQDWIEIDFSSWQSKMNSKDGLVFQLKSAITYQKAVRIQYISTKGKESLRIIDPLRLLYKYKDWYLFGYCKASQAFRLFKLTRIKLCETLSQNVNIYKDIPKSYENDYINQEALTHLELLFHNNVAHKVYDQFEHSLIKRENETQLRVSCEMEEGDWLFSLLLSFGSDVFVEKPMNIRQELVMLHMKAIEHLNCDDKDSD
ncbi:MAG: YafY family transcriptional regulator [Clostridiaceae bacterium]|nr:YafY family transcriptional regulator [Clostridiaceae bacterium]